MKNLLLALLLLLPFTGITQETNYPSYNLELMKSIANSVNDRDFSGMKKYLADNLTIVSESQQTNAVVTSGYIIGFFNFILNTTNLYTFKIYYAPYDENTNIYKLSCYFITLEDKSKPPITLITVFFSETDNMVDIIYLP